MFAGRPDKAGAPAAPRSQMTRQGTAAGLQGCVANLVLQACAAAHVLLTLYSRQQSHRKARASGAIADRK